MSEQKSTLGPILIGCGLFGVLCLLICAGGLAFFVPRAMKQAEEMVGEFAQEMNRQQALESIPEDWHPPAEDATADDLFPESVGSFALSEHDEQADVAQLGVTDVSGRHAVYESSLADIDLYVYQMNDAERDELMERVQEAISDSFQMHMTSSIFSGDAEGFSFRVSPPEQSGWLWSSKGWVFLLVSEDGMATGAFIGDYLKAIQSPEPEVEVAEEAIDVESDPANLPSSESGDKHPTAADEATATLPPDSSRQGSEEPPPPLAEDATDTADSPEN